MWTVPYYTSIAELTSEGEDDFYARFYSYLGIVRELWQEQMETKTYNSLCTVIPTGSFRWDSKWNGKGHSTSVVSEVRYVKKRRNEYKKKEYTFTYQYLGALIDDKSGLLSLVSDDL